MKEFIRALLVFVVLSILTGLAYPFLITRVAQLTFPRQAKGSLLTVNGKISGSALIGQKFTNPGYFHGRPSALEKAYDASNSGGSNFGPSNSKFLKEVSGRIEKVRKDNGLDPMALVPADLILASGSGLDPHISVEAAMVQVRRVAKVRGLQESEVRDVVQRHVEEPLFGFLGQKRINVFQLNLTLDELRFGNGQQGRLKQGAGS
jgi:K+-transporting ATPase ATPase C chain